MSDDVERLIDGAAVVREDRSMALPPWSSSAPLARCSLKR
jgi:hypothetical protein